MGKLKEFIKSTVIGGLLVILPLAIFVFTAGWLFDIVRSTINPLTEMLLARASLPSVAADVIVILLLVAVCFVIGFVVRTSLGKWLYNTVESRFLKKVPGYSLIKETVSQFLGGKKAPFSSVALVQIYGNETMVSAFVTDSHDDGSYTVFVPTGPNPTSGNIYHLKGKWVHPVDVSVEDTMRSIISCGAGSSMLIEKLGAE
jgi:uncharacterized membrane protein